MRSWATPQFAPPAPILDYAGPISRSALRMAARSELTVRDEPGRLVVNERLGGREAAVWALAMAAFTLCLLIATELSMTRHWRRNMEGMALVAGVVAAELVVSMMVINQTWRRTVLQVTPQETSLTFSAPFGTPRHHRWPAEQLARVEVIDSRPRIARGDPVPELELTMWVGPPVRLFIGHPHAQLVQLAGMIQRLQPPLSR